MDWFWISQFIDTIGGIALPFLAAMAAIGVVSMAIIQTAKDACCRRMYHSFRFSRWLGKRLEGKDAVNGIDLIVNDIVSIATDGDKWSFFDLPLEGMCKAITDAMKEVLRNQEKYPNAALLLFSIADARDLDLAKNTTSSKSGDILSLSKVEAARDRISYQVVCSLAAFQLATSQCWKKLMQLMSFGISFLIAIVGYYTYDGRVAENMAAIVALGVVSGILAPVARDLTATIEKLRL